MSARPIEVAWILWRWRWASQFSNDVYWAHFPVDFHILLFTWRGASTRQYSLVMDDHHYVDSDVLSNEAESSQLHAKPTASSSLSHEPDMCQNRPGNVQRSPLTFNNKTHIRPNQIGTNEILLSSLSPRKSTLKLPASNATVHFNGDPRLALSSFDLGGWSG